MKFIEDGTLAVIDRLFTDSTIDICAYLLQRYRRFPIIAADMGT